MTATAMEGMARPDLKESRPITAIWKKGIRKKVPIIANRSFPILSVFLLAGLGAAAACYNPPR